MRRIFEGFPLWSAQAYTQTKSKARSSWSAVSPGLQISTFKKLSTASFCLPAFSLSLPVFLRGSFGSPFLLLLSFLADQPASCPLCIISPY